MINIFANLEYFFAGQNPTFCRIILILEDTPGLFKTYLIGPTPQTYAYTIFYIKMQDTNFAGHLAESRIFKVKSRAVGNYGLILPVRALYNAILMLAHGTVIN